MKWLLLSSVGPNPGDGIIRCGVKELIRAVDPDATIRLVSRTTRAMRFPHPIEYDRAVLAGMAFFYSHRTSATWHESVYEAIMDWAGENPRKMLVAGVGSFAPWCAPLDIAEPDLLGGEVDLRLRRLADGAALALAQDDREQPDLRAVGGEDVRE